MGANTEGTTGSEADFGTSVKIWFPALISDIFSEAVGVFVSKKSCFTLTFGRSIIVVSRAKIH